MPQIERLELHVQLPDDVLLLQSGSNVPLPDHPRSLPSLPEEAPFPSAFLLWVRVRDGDGRTIGHGVEIEHWPDGEVAEGYLWDTCWVFTLPDRGALYVHQHETIGIMQDIIVPMRESGRDWEGEWRRTSTAGPREDGRGLIVGGAGEFAGARGWLTETNNITRMTLDVEQTNHCELTAEFELAEGATTEWPWR